MKKLATLVAVFALALALAPIAVFAQAQQDTVQQSGIQIQNLSTETANVSVRFVPGAGSSASTVTQNITVPGSGSRTLISFGAAGDPNTFLAPAGFNGSVVLESDQPILALTNLTNSAFSITEGYPGFRQGANRVLVPLVLRNNPVAGGNASTAISVQNTGTTAINGTVTYFPGAAGASGQTDTFTSLAAGQSITFKQFAKTSLGDLFVGSAVVEANGPVAVAVTQEGANQLTSYAAFTGGSHTIALPLVVSGNTANNNFTGLQVQNAGDQPTNVTFTFTKNQATTPDFGREPCGNNGVMTPRTVSVDPGASFTLLTIGFTANDVPGAPIEGQPGRRQSADGQFFTCLYVGGATVTSSNGQPLVAIVNQASLVGTRSVSAYEGFTLAQATNDTRAPLVSSGNAGFFTGVQVQNTATSGTTNFTITYSPNTATGSNACGGAGGAMTPRTFPLAAGAAVTLLQLGLGGSFDPNNPALDPQFTNCIYVGSATVTGPAGSTLVAIINQSNIGPFARLDNLTTYNGFNQ